MFIILSILWMKVCSHNFSHNVAVYEAKKQVFLIVNRSAWGLRCSFACPIPRATSFTTLGSAHRRCDVSPPLLRESSFAEGGKALLCTRQGICQGNIFPLFKKRKKWGNPHSFYFMKLNLKWDMLFLFLHKHQSNHNLSKAKSRFCASNCMPLKQ